MAPETEPAPPAPVELDRDLDGVLPESFPERGLVEGRDPAPAARTGTPWRDAETRLGSIRRPTHLPTAMRIRPTFGSAPWTIVFTRGESTTALATRRASPSVRAPPTLTRRSFVAPSPSRASHSAIPRQSRSSAEPNLSRSTPPARPFARSTTVSDLPTIHCARP